MNDESRIIIPGAEHDFYKDGDSGAPEVIKDGNGQIALAMCKVCTLAEGALTTDCPGKVTGRDDEVYAGKVDFIDGEWRTL